GRKGEVKRVCHFFQEFQTILGHQRRSEFLRHRIGLGSLGLKLERTETAGQRYAARLCPPEQVGQSHRVNWHRVLNVVGRDIHGHRYSQLLYDGEGLRIDPSPAIVQSDHGRIRLEPARPQRLHRLIQRHYRVSLALQILDSTTEQFFANEQSAPILVFFRNRESVVAQDPKSVAGTVSRDAKKTDAFCERQRKPNHPSSARRPPAQKATAIYQRHGKSHQLAFHCLSDCRRGLPTHICGFLSEEINRELYSIGYCIPRIRLPKYRGCELGAVG